MITWDGTAKQLYSTVLESNWRFLPVQHGLPSQSHIIAELIRAAGFEGIRYKSTKGLGDCLAIFPESLSQDSFVELVDPAPTEVRHVRLDANTAYDLAGWEQVPHQLRPR